MVHTKMGMFLVRLKERKGDCCDTPRSKSHQRLCIDSYSACSPEPHLSFTPRSDAVVQTTTMQSYR